MLVVSLGQLRVVHHRELAVLSHGCRGPAVLVMPARPARICEKTTGSSNLAQWGARQEAAQGQRSPGAAAHLFGLAQGGVCGADV